MGFSLPKKEVFLLLSTKKKRGGGSLNSKKKKPVYFHLSRTEEKKEGNLCFPYLESKEKGGKKRKN